MNKKLVCILMSAATLASSAAFAVDFDPQFYVGGELQAGQKKGAKKVTTELGSNKTKMDVAGVTKDGKSKNPIHKSATGASLFVGSRLTENLGVELGGSVLKNQKVKKVQDFNTGIALKGADLSIKNRNVYADAMAYLPIDCSMDLIASAGAGYLSTKVNGKLAANPTVDQKFSAKSNKLGVRAGVGAQYKFNENIGARLMVRHQQGNKIVKHVTSTSLGMFYQF